uniref:(northern house mosquito) hypothetical protein n=1 Tax=Culex pipiens TaxID=7175 RepID=A0A8D8JTB7_CULPI
MSGRLGLSLSTTFTSSHSTSMAFSNSWTRGLSSRRIQQFSSSAPGHSSGSVLPVLVSTINEAQWNLARARSACSRCALSKIPSSAQLIVVKPCSLRFSNTNSRSSFAR